MFKRKAGNIFTGCRSDRITVMEDQMTYYQELEKGNLRYMTLDQYTPIHLRSPYLRKLKSIEITSTAGKKSCFDDFDFVQFGRALNFYF